MKVEVGIIRTYFKFANTSGKIKGLSATYTLWARCRTEISPAPHTPVSELQERGDLFRKRREEALQGAHSAFWQCVTPANILGRKNNRKVID